jgi:hypothetical protein
LLRSVGFVAYASDPIEIGETIEAALSAFRRRKGHEATFHSWKVNDIAGRFLLDPILDHIRESKCLVADISTLNFNVTYEIGYAIGLGRRTFLIRNRSLQADDTEIRRVGIFDTLGFQAYENAVDLEAYLLSLNDFSALRTTKSPDPANPVYLLQYPFNTDVQNRIVARVKRARLRFRSFDPGEMSRLSANEAIDGVSGAFGIIVPLARSTMADARVHNLRAAFIAGLAHGLERVTLLIQQGEDPVPLDYRDLVSSFKHPERIDELIGQFALEVTDAWQAPTELVNISGGVLAGLDLGAPNAENEFTTLSSYYLQTDQYQRTLRGEARVVIGRKGAGKTAVFAQVRDRVRSNKKMIVLDLRPEGYQLKKFKEQVLLYLHEGAKEHTITAFWEYLLLLEIAYKVLDKDRALHLNDHKLLEPYRALESVYGRDVSSQEGDFSERMLRLVERIADHFQEKHTGAGTLRLTRQQVTEFLYSHDIRELQRLVVEYLRHKDGLRILFDNLDKGWATNGVTDEDTLIVRCLLDASRKLEQALQPKGVDARSTIFIRNDVYGLLVSGTPDRGKESLVSLDWSEPDHLRELILRRLRYNDIGKTGTFEEAWRTICVSHTSSGEESSQYLIDRSLMRPRFLLNLVNHCKANAVNSGHNRIEQGDIEKGVAAYSTDLIYDIGYEIRDIIPSAEDILYHFLGSPSEVRASDLVSDLYRKHSPDLTQRIIEVLIWYGVLGVVRNGGEVAYIYSVSYDVKRLYVMRDRTPESERRYHLNPAFWIGLEIVPQPMLV